MGRSNRTAALERKIELLLGEREQNQEDITKAEGIFATIPALQDRIAEIEGLIAACEAVIKSDQPDWTSDDLRASRPFKHKIPIKLGNCSRMSLDVLRLAEAPMRVREIAIAVLKREGHEEPDSDTVTKVANTIGNALKKKLARGYVATDGEWPGSWWAVRPPQS